jgi:hypothetical protein
VRVGSPPHVSRLKRIARQIARPVTSPIDGRVADINRRIGHTNEHVGAEADALRALIRRLEDTLSAGIESYARASSETTSYVGLELRELADTVLVLGDMTRGLEESTRGLEESTRGLEESTRGLGEATREMTTATYQDYYRERLARAQGMPLEQLDGELAQLLNHAAGHRGFAAQAELWFNPPVTVELRAGEARLAVVNERIVELPFAMAALGRVEPAARILDIGSAESTFPLSAASLGYMVTAIDPRSLPYSHPNLEVVSQRFEDWRGPSGSFAAAFLISTIEHVGLPAYGVRPFGDAAPGVGADVAMLDRVSGLLAADGLLVLTTPYGPRGVDDFQRTYDDEALSELLARWTVLERRVVLRRDDLVWMANPEGESDGEGVVMILATPTPTQ